MADKNEWINNTTYKCDSCESIFKVFTPEENPGVWFCPFCASRNLSEVED